MLLPAVVVKSPEPEKAEHRQSYDGGTAGNGVRHEVEQQKNHRVIENVIRRDNPLIPVLEKPASVFIKLVSLLLKYVQEKFGSQIGMPGHH